MGTLFRLSQNARARAARRLCNGHAASPMSLQLGRIDKNSSVPLLKSCSAHFMPQVPAFFSTLALRTSFADPAHTESEDASPVLLGNNQTSSTAAVNKHWPQRAHVTETRHALAVAANICFNARLQISRSNANLVLRHKKYLFRPLLLRICCQCQLLSSLAIQHGLALADYESEDNVSSLLQGVNAEVGCCLQKDLSTARWVRRDGFKNLQG